MTDKGYCYGKLSVIWRILLYFLLILSPLLLKIVTGEFMGLRTAYGFSLTAAMVGFTMLMLQPVLAARYRWIEKPLGLDRLFRIHRITGIAGGTLALLHPLLLAIGLKSTGILLRLDVPWPILVGKVILLLLIFFAVSAIFHGKFRIPFQRWFRTHSIITPVILTGIFVHSFAAAVRYQSLPVRILWLGLFVLGIFSYLHLALFRRLGGRLKPYVIKGVKQETHNVWSLELSPPEGIHLFKYLPGQFLFITLLRDKGLPVEEHPFTIASCPSRTGSVTVTVKESGDFTSTIGQTKTGDRAVVMAPFGRFSHLLHAHQKKMVFIAGGIGITPLMSMLRFMRDTGAEAEVTLFNFNRTRQDIVFAEELDSMEKCESDFSLRVIHVLSKPEATWQGESGYISRDMLRSNLKDVPGREYYICGPPVMMDSALKILKELGAVKRRIHLEKFML